MICLNESINFNKKNLEKNLVNELGQMIKLEFELDLDNRIIEKINKSIKDKINQCFNYDHFIYKNMDNKYCTHKYKRGKQDGYFCCKKINTNLNGKDKDYLCASHSKIHIPKKRIDKNTGTAINTAIGKSNYDNRKIFKKKKNKKNIYICNYGLLNISKILTRLL